mmetsp:Transcript_18055/g.68466  ORF Transcript_18055/g.68466 Transcript_18055/m.68466 type:complete len:531 (-) Transcript_18055:96-1688(-)
MVYESTSLADFREQLRHPKKLVISYFGAPWCGPCQMYSPQYEALAHATPAGHFIKVQDTARDVVMDQGIRAFPTTKFFVDGELKDEVRGADINSTKRIVEELSKHLFAAFAGSGATLGGTGGPASAEEQRQARLRRFNVPTQPKEEPRIVDENAMEVCGPDGCTPAASGVPTEDEQLQAAIAMSMSSDEPAAAAAPEAGKEEDQAMDEDADGGEDKELSEGVGKQLVDMGFGAVRCRKALRSVGVHADLDSCLNWLTEHQDDADIDDEATMPPKPKEFTPEEKAAQLAKLQERIAERRAERAQEEKAGEISREATRRQQGKETLMRREEMERMARIREAEKIKKEKAEARVERQRILAELERDKRERMANNGKLGSRLGVEGYKPSGVQYDAEGNEAEAEARPAPTPQALAATVSPADAPQVMDQCIESMSQYRAGGDGGKALDILMKIIRKIVENPGVEKFERLNMDGKAYRSKIKPFVGGQKFMIAAGFAKKSDESGNHMVLENRDDELLQTALQKLEAGLQRYNTRA